jgi:dolichol-phosphate mannosyltransferase
MQHFSIIIPTLNEVANIEPLLDRIQLMAQQHGMDPEIIFVDDGSSDGSREQIKTYAGPLQVKLIERNQERGLTGAVVAGARASGCDLVVVMDSDLSHPPESIPALLELLRADSLDMVIGSRYIAGGETSGWPFFRKAASNIASLPARLLTRVHDPLSGFFAIHKQYLTVVESDLSGFKIGLEVIAGAGRNFKVGEVPIVFQDRSFGQSKMTGSIVGKYLQQLVRLFFKRPEVRGGLPLIIIAILAGLVDASLFSLITSMGFGLDTSHISSFLTAAGLCYFITAILDHSRPHPAEAGGFFRFAIITLFILSLRGGVLSLPLLGISSSPRLLMVLLAATTCCSLPAALWISRRRSPAKSVNWRVFGFLLIGYTLLLRLIYLGNIELLQEEAYYWNYAQHLAPGYLDHPPMVALLISFGTLLFGNNELGVRFGAFICWFITALYVYKLTQSIFNRDAAFKAIILVAVLPIFFGVALVMTPDAPLIACWSGALYSLYRALVPGERTAWYPAGIWLGLGLVSKYTIAFLGPAIVLFLLLDASSRKWLLKPEPYLAAILALAIFSPVIWWNYDHDWASFLFQSRQRLQHAPSFSTDQLLGSILILLTPTGFLAVLYTMRPRLARLEFLHAKPGNVSRRSYFFCMIMVIVPLSFFALLSFRSGIKLNWTGPIWLALLPFIAWTMTRHKDKPLWLVTRLWPSTLVTLTLGYGILLHYFAIGLPGLSYSSSDFLFGWENLAQQVETEIETIEKNGGDRPLVAGIDRYRIASGLAFYRNKQRDEKDSDYLVDETTGRQLFDNNALMYNYWYPSALASKKDILVISQKKERLAPTALQNYCRLLGKIGEITVTKRGKKAGRYYYRLLTGYIPKNV